MIKGPGRTSQGRSRCSHAASFHTWRTRIGIPFGFDAPLAIRQFSQRVKAAAEPHPAIRRGLGAAAIGVFSEGAWNALELAVARRRSGTTGSCLRTFPGAAC